MSFWQTWLLSLCVLVSACFASNAAISAPASVDAPPLVFLAKHERWLALLHWNQGTTFRNRNRSYVTDDAFFLSPHGRYDALSELEATVKALKPEGSVERCLFPARYRFLSEQLHWPLEGAFDHCEEYQEWRSIVPSGRVVLVFPAAYLNSPSSMFGHTLLRLDASDSDEQSSWLSWAVNFGAVMDDEASILYIYRGLAGSYPGYFSTVPYHTKIQEYAHIENRDMWEYSLDLNDNERSWLIEHLWELQNIRFDYYFLDENCSFRLLELMEVARPNTGVLSDFRFTEIPVDTVRTMVEAGFVEQGGYRPSKAVELKALSAGMSANERRLARRLVKQPDYNAAPFAELSLSEQRRVVKAAYELLRFQQRNKERDAVAASKSMELLRRLNTYPQEPDIKPIKPSQPELGHGTKMLALTGGALEKEGYGQLEYRWAYHDWFDPPTGFLEGAQIEAFSLKLRYDNTEKLELQELKLVDIRSLAPRDTFVKPISWYVQGGFERLVVEEDYSLTSYIEAGPGMSWQWGDVRPYAFASARLEHTRLHRGNMEFGTGAMLGALWYAPNGVVLGAGAESIYFFRDKTRHQGHMTISVPVARQHAIRFSAKHQAWRKNGDTEMELSWRYHFD